MMFDLDTYLINFEMMKCFKKTKFGDHGLKLVYHYIEAPIGTSQVGSYGR